jgi:hypothetical protein
MLKERKILYKHLGTQGAPILTPSPSFKVKDVERKKNTINTLRALGAPSPTPFILL